MKSNHSGGWRFHADAAKASGMTDYRPEHFKPLIGTVFAVEHGEPALDLTLDEVRPLPVSQRPGGGFALDFSGPATPMLAQGMVTLTQGDTRHDLFLVPTARDEFGHYEAIFN